MSKISWEFNSEIIKQLFEPLGFKLTSVPKRESEGAEYDAARFSLNGLKVIFRRAKLTPKKQGLFVTLWQRSVNSGKIEPIDSCDDFDLVAVWARENDKTGMFIFKKDILVKKGILAIGGQGGKLAFRLYTPWSKTLSKQALSSQKWQCEYWLS